ncbi:MAG: magnesium transporter [Cellvibrionales bacterium]|nr:magnesium transporter [Cellvibrionales bacterium]
MDTPSNKRFTQDHLETVTDAIDTGRLYHVAKMLNTLNHQDVAHLIESSPPKVRQALWQMLEEKHKGEVLQYLSEDIQSNFLESMNVDEVVAATEGLDEDNAADLLQNLPNRIIQEVLQSMDKQDRERVERVMHYPEDTAGGLMSTDLITVKPSITLDVVLRYLRRHEELPASTDTLFVVNRRDEFIGLLPISRILVSHPNTTVREIMITNIKTIPVNMPEKDVALLFERHDWVSAPVISDEGKLLGRITIDDVVDVIRDQADHNMLSMAGLSDDEDTFASIQKTAPRRNIWLGINLVTAIMASLVIKLFEGTIEQIVAVAVLMPIVASMGGIAGSQTLTLVIRGIALGQIGRNNFQWLLRRELVVGMINGLLWAMVVALATALLYDDLKLSWIIGMTMILNLVLAAFVATVLPSLLKQFGIDPALAGNVILTTFTDVIGFFSFLGLVTWLYL